MAKQQFNISIEYDLMVRFTRIYGEGNRAKRISELVEKDCIDAESKQLSEKARRITFEKYYKPFIVKYAGGRDPFYLLENEGLRIAFKDSDIKISESDIKLCIEQLIVEGEE